MRLAVIACALLAAGCSATNRPMGVETQQEPFPGPSSSISVSVDVPKVVTVTTRPPELIPPATTVAVAVEGETGSAAKGFKSPSPEATGESQTAETSVAPSLPEPPTTTTVRDLLAECRATVAELLPIYPPAPGWANPVCQPQQDVRDVFGFIPEGYVLWDTKTIHLQPSNPGLDLTYLYMHEVGHSHCAVAGDYTEACADAWAGRHTT